MSIPHISYMAFPGTIAFNAPPEPSKDYVERIVAEASKAQGIIRQRLFVQNRTPKIVETRQIIAFCIRLNKLMSLTETGAFLGQHHTTVMHSVSTVQDRMDTEPEYKVLVQRILNNSKKKPW